MIMLLFEDNSPLTPDYLLNNQASSRGKEEVTTNPTPTPTPTPKKQNKNSFGMLFVT